MKCGDVIESIDVHDYVSCKCGAISIDGGHEYIRVGCRDKADYYNINDFNTVDGKLIKYEGDDENVLIPNDVKIIDEKAFEDCKNIKVITVPNGVEKVYFQAFFKCPNIEEIHFQNDDIKIAAFAFLEVGEFTIYASTGSRAYEYAKRYNIPCVNE